ncbi:DgyrCDS2480 [Dimorphilus gyrociliatus]|uniref:Autophagy-related protein 27 n=1 Tax=Dimorphilus gyrociliatus TaxID=2664684 RepID=A0A7I8VAT5_9ANNE|nr:DgyrCDS2480 [Dimorphilus gyrociliatus]
MESILLLNKRRNFHKLLINILIIIGFLGSSTNSETCSVTKLKFAIIPGDLRVVYNDSGRYHDYTFNLCNAVSCGDSTDAVMCNKTTATSTPFAELKSVNITNDDSSTILDFTDNKKEQNLNVLLLCGKTLGTPKITVEEHSENTEAVSIKWETGSACAIPPARKFVPCYAYNKNHELIDLNPLGLRNPFKYLMSDNSTIHISVCSTIPSKHLKDCSSEAVCKTFADEKAKKLGRPSKGIQLNDDESLTITYKSATSETKVTFRCPKDDTGIGQIKLISNIEDSYEFEIETEYACPLRNQIVKGNKLTMEKNGINFDLAVFSDNAYNTSTDKYTYFIGFNKGSKILEACGLEHALACQKYQNSNQKIGGLDEYLSYFDGKITLTIKDGRPCRDKFHRQTIIDFICDPSAKNVVLKHIREDHCLYFFEAYTKQACLHNNRKIFQPCLVEHNGQVFDISPLKNKNWRVLPQDNENKDEIFISPCSFLNPSSEEIKCNHIPTSVCLSKPDDKYGFRYGNLSMSPVYDKDTKSLKMTSVGGDLYIGNNKPRKAEINFECGTDETSTPTYIKEENILYIDWFTKYACQSNIIVGDECKVSVNGYDINLFPLTHEVFTINGTDEYYKLKICNNFELSNWAARRCVKDKCKDLAPANQKLQYKDQVLQLIYSDKGSPKVKISFICDRDVSLAELEISQRNKATTAIEVRTPHACINPSMECTYIDRKGNKFDLTKLAGISYAIEDSKYDYRFSICTPLKDVPFNCHETSTLCAKDKETEEVLPEIATITGAKMEDLGGHILITYPNPEDGEQNKTHISFQCSTQQSYTILTDFAYNHIINFHTPLVCPVKHYENRKNCSIEYQGQKYLIEPIKKTIQLKINDKEEDFTLQACGEKSGIYKNDEQYYSSNNELETINDHRTNFKVDFTQIDKKKPNLEVRFGCDRKKQTKVRVKEDDSTIVIILWIAEVCEYKTSVGCETPQFSFDFLRSKPYYEIEDTNGKLFLSICQSLPPKFEGPCRGAGACLEYKNGTKVSLGYLQSHLESDGDGAIITYKGGKKCNGASKVTITFLVKDGFEFKRQGTDDCEYNFQFLTPAYKNSEKRIGSDCSVTDPVYNYKFDLSSLKAKTNKVESNDKQYNFFLSVCQADKNSPCEKGIGACQEIVQDPVAKKMMMGNINDKLQWVNQKLRLKYTGGTKCHGIFKRSTVIDFICDRQVEKIVYINETENCEYQFEWFTALACRSFETTPTCSAEDSKNNKIYNFSPLTKTSSNYIVDGKDVKFAINLCAPVIDKPYKVGQIGVNCPAHSSVCLLKDHEKSEMLSSVVATEFSVSDGKVDINFKDSKHKVNIAAECSENEGEPEFVSQEEKDSIKEYKFIWSSKYFCPIDTKPDETIGKDCKVIDKETGYVFDLNHFSKTPLTFKTEKYEYKISFCHLLKEEETSCKNSYACQTELSGLKKSFSLGTKKSAVEFKGGAIYVNYTLGNKCSSKKERNISIAIKCPETSQIDLEPQIIEISHCDYSMTWFTKQMCERPMKCSVKNNKNRYFDLSDLILNKESYKVKTSKYTLYFNLCGYVRGMKDCSSDSFACAKVIGSNQYLSLGSGLNDKPLEYKNGAIHVFYSNGSACTEDKSKRVTTKIIIDCGLETSMRAEYYDCTFLIYWSMPRLCEETCVKSVQRDFGYNLNSILSDISKSNTKLGDCLKSKDHKCSAIKYQDASYGSWESCNYKKISDGFEVNFNNGDKCSEGKKSSKFVIACKDKQFLREYMKTDCELSFVYETPQACPTQKVLCASDHYNLSPLMNEINHVKNKDSIYHVGICNGIKNIDGCPKNTVVCLEKSGKFLPMAYLNTKKLQEFEKTNEPLVLTYTSAPIYYTECGNKYVQVAIYFICDKENIGAMEFISWDSDKCQLSLRWKTYYGCPTTKHLVQIKDGIIKEGPFVIDLSNSSVYKKTTVTDAKSNKKITINLAEKKGAIISSEENDKTIAKASNIKYYIENYQFLMTSRLSYYSTTVYFQCSDKDEKPELSIREDRIYTINWKTKATCLTKPLKNSKTVVKKNSNKLKIFMIIIGCLICLLVVGIVFVKRRRIMLYWRRRRFNADYYANIEDDEDHLIDAAENVAFSEECNIRGSPFSNDVQVEWHSQKRDDKLITGDDLGFGSDNDRPQTSVKQKKNQSKKKKGDKQKHSSSTPSVSSLPSKSKRYREDSDDDLLV